MALLGTHEGWLMQRQPYLNNTAGCRVLHNQTEGFRKSSVNRAQQLNLLQGRIDNVSAGFLS